MFDEIANVTKEKDRIKRKAYARINTNLGALNVELHCDKAPKTCYNWIMLAKAGKYDGCVPVVSSGESASHKPDP